jgi:MFS family permease
MHQPGTAPPQTQDGPPPSRNPFLAAGFTRWWAASMVAGTGVGIQSVTVPLFIRDRVAFDERALAISGALVATSVPAAVLALLGGAVADRIERRRILARTYSVAALVSTAYVGLCLAGVRSIWPVFPLAALVGSAGAFTNPARQSLLPQLVSRAQLQNGVIFGTMGFMAALQFLGPSIAGLVVDAAGLAVAFSLEVVLLTSAAATFSRVHAPPSERSGRSMLGDLGDGLRYLRGERAISSLLLLGAIPGIFFIGPFSVTIALVVPDVFGAPDKWVGLLWGCFGAGVLCGSLALSRWPIPRRGLAVCISTFTGGSIEFLYGSTGSLHAAAGILFVWGMSASIFMNYVTVLVQEHAEPRMMGRVMSVMSLIFFASTPIGYGQAGLVTRAFGPQATLLASGFVAALIGLGCVGFLRPVRRLA